MFASTSPDCPTASSLVSLPQICPPCGLQGIHLKTHVTLSRSRSKLVAPSSLHYVGTTELSRSLTLKHRIYACVLSRFSCVRLFVTPWTVAHQAPPSAGFSRQKYWSELLCSPPGDLPKPGIKPTSLMSPALADRFFTTGAIWEA